MNMIFTWAGLNNNTYGGEKKKTNTSAESLLALSIGLINS